MNRTGRPAGRLDAEPGAGVRRRDAEPDGRPVALAQDVFHVDVDVRILGVEAVDHRCDDPALSFGRSNVGFPAIFGAAFAEEALEIDVGLVVGLGTTAEREREQQCGGGASHRTAVPAIARTICFWKTM